jgi:hypothetical protein
VSPDQLDLRSPEATDTGDGQADNGQAGASPEEKPDGERSADGGRLDAREVAELELASAERGDLDADGNEDDQAEGAGGRALAVLRRGLRESPELRRGMAYTVGMALAGAGGRLLVPILVQQILDHGFDGPAGFRPWFVYGLSAAAAVMVLLTYLTSRLTFVRMVRASE